MINAMKITRENHSKFMSKALPLLTFIYFIQSYFYLKYGPEGLSQEVVGCLGLGLAGIFAYYLIYDKYHEIIFHSTYLEIRFSPLQIHHECFYREIVDVEIKDGKKNYDHVLIHLRNGEILKLAHVDNPHTVRKYLLERA